MKVLPYTVAEVAPMSLVILIHIEFIRQAGTPVNRGVATYRIRIPVETGKTCCKILIAPSVALVLICLMCYLPILLTLSTMLFSIRFLS
jgi:hypothetical protein